jgi:hypothetical protein
MNNRDKIHAYLDADIPILLWGDPGTGKTATIVSLAQQKGVHLEIVIGSTLDPTDLGRPVVQEDGSICLVPPPWVSRIRGALDDGKTAWLFLDELTSAPPSVQAALLRVVNERVVSDTSIEGCRMIAAANPEASATAMTPLSHSTANRWAHLPWQVDVQEWCTGEMSGWGKPDPDLAELRTLVTSWVQHNHSALLDPPDDIAEDVRGWASPRSWSAAVRVIRTVDTLKADIGREFLASLVGKGAAIEFVAWTHDQDIPNPVELLEGRKSFPSRGDKTMLAASSIISYAVTHPEYVPKVWVALQKMRKDIGLTLAQMAIEAFEYANIEVETTSALRKLIATKKEV